MQQVNLYHQEFHTRHNHKSIIILLSMCAVILVFAGIDYMQLKAINKLDRQLMQKQDELATVEKSLEIIKQKAKPMAKDMTLAIELEKIRQANTSKLRASKYLSGNDTGNMVGFSALLEGLGRQRDTIEKLWLTKIELNNGGYDLRLSGKSHEPKLLPLFIEALSDEALYRNREFRQMKISRSDNIKNMLDFVLDTRHSDSGKNDTDHYSTKAMFIARLKQFSEQQSGVEALNAEKSDDTQFQEQR